MADFQEAVTHSTQITILSTVCNILLEKYKTILANDIKTQIFFCNTLWQRIAEKAIQKRNNSALFTEYIRFIQLFFHHQYELPKIIVVNLLRALVDNYKDRTNESIELVGLIVKNLNLNTIENGKEIQVKTLNWLYPTIQNLNLKQLMKGDDDITVNKIAELTVLCVFSKFKSENDQLLPLSSSTFCVEEKKFVDYQKYTQKLCENLQFKSLNKLILLPSLITNDTRSIELPMTNELKSVINEEMFQKLYDILMEKDANTDETDVDDFKTFIMHSTKIILYTNIVHQLIAYESLDKHYFRKNFLIKKIILKLEQINMALSKLNAVIHNKQSMDILTKLSTIFSNQFCEILCDIFCQQHLDNLLNWLKYQITSEEYCPAKLIELKTYDSLSFVDAIRYKSFMILSYLCVGTNADAASDIIMNYEFDFNYNGDICIVLQLIKVRNIFSLYCSLYYYDSFVCVTYLK